MRPSCIHKRCAHFPSTGFLFRHFSLLFLCFRAPPTYINSSRTSFASRQKPRTVYTHGPHSVYVYTRIRRCTGVKSTVHLTRSHVDYPPRYSSLRAYHGSLPTGLAITLLETSEQQTPRRESTMLPWWTLVRHWMTRNDGAKGTRVFLEPVGPSAAEYLAPDAASLSLFPVYRRGFAGNGRSVHGSARPPPPSPEFRCTHQLRGHGTNHAHKQTHIHTPHTQRAQRRI